VGPLDAAALQVKLAQAKLGGFAALGLREGAGAEALRSAYLDACKRYHPNRFARHPDPTCKVLAQEIFIAVRRAYELLAAGPQVGQGSERREVTSPGVRVPLPPERREVTSPGVRVPLPPERREVTSPGVRVPLPPERREVTSPGVRVPLPPERREATSPGVRVPTSPAGPGRMPTPAPMRAAPAASGSAAAKPPTPPRAGTPPVGLQPGGRPTSGPSLFEITRARELRFQAALADSAAGRHADARKALAVLATESQDRRFRVQLFLVWGHEHRAEGKLDLAGQDYQRALVLDPQCEDARTALAALASDRRGR
jgi:hypothetical protein